MPNPSIQRLRIAAVPAVATLALVLTACSSMAATASASRTATAAATPSGQVVTPGEVDSIVASDTAINNNANASLSMALQDSHESCLQEVLDDTTYRGELAAGAKTLGGSFDQVPRRAFVPHENTYPAYFSVLAEDRASSQPTTTNLLTYVKVAPSAQWKLSSSSEILGPTDAGVSVPETATGAQGYATSLDVQDTNGMLIAPDQVAGRVASAFTAEAATGKLPTGISAEFGPKSVADPHTIAAAYSEIGPVTTTFSATVPASAAAGRPSRDCPSPAYRLADGGALVSFTVFSQIHVKVRSGEAVVQPSNRSALGMLLPPGTYSSVTLTSGDMAVAIVPPAESKSPIDVIGQASEGLIETGVTSSGSSSPIASGGPADASSIAKAVNPGLVDIDVTFGYENVRGAGTGMVLTPNGEVLTNNHVIDGETSIRVTDVGNGRTYGAKVLGYDRSSDVAVLQLEGASGLQPVSLGNSTSVHNGAAVVAIGNAGGNGGTPSYAGGRVTALDQSITASDEADGTSEQLVGLIETNADIQPGDSGGPLVNSSGKVISMDTAASSGFSFEQGGISAVQGFSIPIDTALTIAKEITASQATSAVHIGATAFLGVSVISGASSGFGEFGRPVPRPTSSGAVIASVVSGRPAAKAGLAAGDTITSIGGHSVTSANSLTTVLMSEMPDGAVSIVYLDSSGVKHTVTVHLESGPPQ
jgi:S1-C subfamily serine protease